MDKMGFVKLHRKLLDNPIASNPLLIGLFCYLLLLVSHKDHIFYLGKIRIDQKKGEAIISKKEIAKSFKISRGTLDSYLNILHIEHIISIKTTSKYTVLTIINWCKYQVDDIKLASTGTSTGHQLEHQPDTINNDKKKKNDKSIIDILKNDDLINERGIDILQAFVDYRSETDTNGKEKRQKEKTWNTNLRLKRWKANTTTNFGKNKIIDYEVIEDFHRGAMANKRDDIKQYFRDKYKEDELRRKKYWDTKTKRKENPLYLETSK